MPAGLLAADTLVPVSHKVDGVSVVDLVRMRSGACTKPVPEWDAAFNTPSVALPCPLMAWQFAIDCLFDGGVDFDVVNPDSQAATALLNRLVIP